MFCKANGCLLFLVHFFNFLVVDFAFGGISLHDLLLFKDDLLQGPALAIAYLQVLLQLFVAHLPTFNFSSDAAYLSF
jgi:hypothetical protein